MNLEQGLIEWVEIEDARSITFGDASAGDTELTVVDGSVFADGIASGQLQVDGVVIAYDSVDLGDDDGDPSVLQLAAPLGADVDDGTAVDLYPRSSTTNAGISVPGSAVGDIVTVRVPATARPLLALGPRFGDSRELAWFFEVGDRKILFDWDGDIPVVQPDSAPLPSSDVVRPDSTPDYYVHEPKHPTDSFFAVYTAAAAAAIPSDQVAWFTTWTLDQGDVDMAGQLFDDAHSPSGDTTTYPVGDLWPAWLIPTGGRSARATLDSFTWGGTDWDGAYNSDNAELAFIAIDDLDDINGSSYLIDDWNMVGEWDTDHIVTSDDTWQGSGAMTSRSPSEAFDYPGHAPAAVLIVVLGSTDGSYDGDWTTNHTMALRGLRVVLGA